MPLGTAEAEISFFGGFVPFLGVAASGETADFGRNGQCGEEQKKKKRDHEEEATTAGTTRWPLQGYSTYCTS